MDRNYYFAIPEVARPIGGINVLIDYMVSLRSAGHSVALLYPSAYYSYPFLDNDLDSVCDPGLPGRPSGWYRRPAALKAEAIRLRSRAFKPKVNRRLVLGGQDVIVAPEFNYPEVMATYPDRRWILAVQDVFGFMRAWTRDVARGGNLLETVDAIFATSRACHDAVKAVAPDLPVTLLPLGVPTTDLTFREEKAMVVAYMPRKRKDEAAWVIAMLRRMPAFEGVRFEELAGMTRPQVHRAMSDALFFLSFSKEEGFGLPPAEAMAAGCIVIGYTGVGGSEFFDDRSGIVVPDGDVVGFAQATAEAVREYRSDPGRLNDLRRHASNEIRSRYSSEQAVSTLVAFWNGLNS